jgi:hypothetical protein
MGVRKMTEEFNLSEKMFCDIQGHKHGEGCHIVAEEQDVKEFIKWCEAHSFPTDDRRRVITINKLKEGAGDKLI